MRKTRAAGFQMLEVVVILAIIGLVSTLGLPSLLRLTRSQRVGLAAAELVGVLRTARSQAIRYSSRVGVKFRVGDDGRVSFALYRDGDGDGVRTRDIASGVDPQVAPFRELAHLGRDVRFGFPPGPAPRDPGNPRRRLGRLDDPIRFNRSDLASFDPLGGSTPGSLYLTDGRYHLKVVRVFGYTGKVKVLSYDPGSETWR
ncbi:MAG: GspH/FimT family pseudopilin [Thermoanaerobaculia bacterium]